MSADLVELADFVGSLAGGEPEAAIYSSQIVAAASQLEEATRLLGELRQGLGRLLFGDMLDDELIGVLTQIARMARYQRRFRGQRDRALRRLMNDRVLDSE